MAANFDRDAYRTATHRAASFAQSDSLRVRSSPGLMETAVWALVLHV
jgi:hypothetical protein